MLKLKLQYFGHLTQRADSLEKLWCWEGLGAGGKGDDRGWDGWMASLTRWTWVWVNSGSWWWTGRPGVLRLMGSQRVGHDWATELNWTELNRLCWGRALPHYWSRKKQKSESEPQAALKGDISLLLQVGEGCLWDKALIVNTPAVMPVGMGGGTDFIVIFSYRTDRIGRFYLAGPSFG